MADLDLTEPL